MADRVATAGAAVVAPTNGGAQPDKQVRQGGRLKRSSSKRSSLHIKVGDIVVRCRPAPKLHPSAPYFSTRFNLVTRPVVAHINASLMPWLFGVMGLMIFRMMNGTLQFVPIWHQSRSLIAKLDVF